MVKPAELTANPKPEAAADHLDQLAVKGTVRGSTSAPTVTARVTSPSGTAQNIAYRNLAVDATYGGQAVTISSLKVAAFSGTLDGNARATLGAEPVFNVGLNLHGIDLQQALVSQKSKAADTVRGQLTGQVRVEGRGDTFDKIKPTLSGNGQMAVANGKLIGVNIAAQAMRKVQGMPGINTLITPSIVARHPTLFNSPDTNLTEFSLTCVIQGPKITSHDIKAVDARLQCAGRRMVRPGQEHRHERASSAVEGAERRADVPEKERGLPGQRSKADRYPGANQRAVAQALGAAGHPVPGSARRRASDAEAGGQSLLNKFLGGNSKNGFSGSNPLGGALNKLFH